MAFGDESSDKVLVAVVLVVVVVGFLLLQPKTQTPSGQVETASTAPAKSKGSSSKAPKSAVVAAGEAKKTAEPVVKTTASKPTTAPAPTKKTVESVAPSPKKSPSEVLEFLNSMAVAEGHFEIEGKRKKAKETPEQKEARVKRQAANKQLKATEAVSAAAAVAPAAAKPEPKPVAVKPRVEDEWIIVEDKKKLKPKKVKPVEEVAVPVASNNNSSGNAAAVDTKSFTVDSKRVGSLVGPKGAMLRAVQELTCTVIQLPKAGEPSSETAVVTVTGPPGGVAKAIQILGEIAANGTSVSLLASQHSTAAPAAPVAESAAPAAAEPAAAPAPATDFNTTTVTVESKKMGSIIGPKGATLHAIQDSTGTLINTAVRGKDGAVEGSTQVTVSGPTEGVKKAVKAINELASKGYCALLSGDNFQESFVMVHPRFLPEIIGKSGASIRAIQDHTSTRVVVPQTPVVAAGKNAVEQPVRIGLAGSREGVAAAKQIIQEITEVFHHSVTHPGIVHVNVDIDESYYNVIIGVKGSEIRHIQGNFKVNVKIPNETTVFKSIIVLGELSNCEAAAKYMHKLVDKLEARLQERENQDQHGDDEENYDEDLMNRYVYSRQNKFAPEPVAVREIPVAESPLPAPKRPISERPPGFSPLGADETISQHSVPLVWGQPKPAW